MARDPCSRKGKAPFAKRGNLIRLSREKKKGIKTLAPVGNVFNPVEKEEKFSGIEQ